MSSLKAGPNCMAVDKKGRIFVGTGGTYQLHMFDTDGTLKSCIRNWRSTHCCDLF